MNQNSTEIFYMFRYSFLTQRYLDFVFASNILQDRQKQCYTIGGAGFF